MHLNLFFSQKLIVRHVKPARLMSGSAWCFTAIKIASFLLNELYTVARCFSKTVASYSPVLLAHEKNNKNQTIKAIY